MADIGTIITQIIDIMYGFLVEGGAAFGQGLQSIVNAVFFTTSGDTTSLSAFGIIVFIFAGISLLVGLTRFIVNIIGSIGARL